MQVSAGDRVRFVPQTLPAAFRERLELDAKVALLRRAAAGELAAEQDLVTAFEVCTGLTPILVLSPTLDSHWAT